MSRPLLSFAMLLLLGVLVGPTAAPASALCAAAESSLSLRSMVAGTRPSAAGLVVVRGRSSPLGSEIADLGAVRFVDAGQATFPLLAEEVATGVWVLRPSTALTAGRYELHGVSSRPMPVELTSTPVFAQHTPTVRRLVRRRETSGAAGPAGRTARSSVLEAEFVGSPPGGAILIAQWQEGAVAASTWGIVGGTGERATAILASDARCAGHGRFPRRGAAVTFRVLDLYGQLSEPSASVRAP